MRVARGTHYAEHLLHTKHLTYFIAFNPLYILSKDVSMMPMPFSTHVQSSPFSIALLCPLEGQQAPLSSSFCQLNGRPLHEMEEPGRVRFQYFFPPSLLGCLSSVPFPGAKVPGKWPSPYNPLVSLFLGYRESNSCLLSLALTYSIIFCCPFFSNTDHTSVNGKILPK